MCGAVLGVLANERQRPFNKLERPLVAQPPNLKPGSGQKGLAGARIVCCRVMFSLEDPVAILEPLRCFQMETAARAGQKRLTYRLMHHGVGKLEVLTIGHDQPAGDKAFGIKAVVIDQMAQG